MTTRRDFMRTAALGTAGAALSAGSAASLIPGLAQARTIAHGTVGTASFTYPGKELFDSFIPGQGDRNQVTLRQMLKDLGTPDFDVERYINSRQGAHLMKHSRMMMTMKDDMDPKVLAFWRGYGKGLIKTVHDLDTPRPWAAYVPVSALRPENRHRTYPLMLQIHEKGSLMGESYGHAFVCAEDEVILIAPFISGVSRSSRPGGNQIAQLGRTPENVDDVWAILQKAVDMFPVDRRRIYSTGFSHPGWMSTWLTMQHPEFFAGHMLNSHPWAYVWDFPGADLVARARKVKMPFIDIVGMKDYGFVYPVTSAVNQMTRNGHDHDRTAEQALLRPNFWFDINDCPPLSMEEARAAQGRAAGTPEHEIGMPLHHAQVVRIDDTRHFIGDSPSRDGVVRTRWIGIENVPHWPAGSYARLAWDFVKHFSRDPRTSASLWDGRTTPATPALTLQS
jgi:poly(3-hydroxybutyrate) depolymerase